VFYNVSPGDNLLRLTNFHCIVSSTVFWWWSHFSVRDEQINLMMWWSEGQNSAVKFPSVFIKLTDGRLGSVHLLESIWWLWCLWLIILSVFTLQLTGGKVIGLNCSVKCSSDVFGSGGQVTLLPLCCFLITTQQLLMKCIANVHERWSYMIGALDFFPLAVALSKTFVGNSFYYVIRGHLQQSHNSFLLQS